MNHCSLLAGAVENVVPMPVVVAAAAVGGAVVEVAVVAVVVVVVVVVVVAALFRFALSWSVLLHCFESGRQNERGIYK